MSISDLSESLYLPGKRWRRERREVALWAAVPFVFGYGIAFLVAQPPYPLVFPSFGGVILLLMAVLLAVLFPHTRGPYQAIQLEDGQLQIEERQRQQVVALEALAAVEGVLVSPKARNRPARYELRLLGAGRTMLGAFNANAFEAAQIQVLLDRLRAQRPALRVDLMAMAQSAER